MLEYFDFSPQYNDCFKSIFSTLSDRELSKLHILITKTEGTKIYTENGDNIREIDLGEHTTIIESKQEEIKTMDLVSLRMEIYKKAYESLMIKKKDILQSIQQSSSIVVSTTNAAKSYIEILRLQKQNPNFVAMINPITFRKLIWEILENSDNRMAVKNTWRKVKMYKSRTLRNYLKSLEEKELYEPLKNIFIGKGYRIIITHGSHEKGKDLIGTNDRENILINVKKGSIDSQKWKTDVHPSLEIMMKTPLKYVEFSQSLPQRFLLIFNGDLQPKVAEDLKNINDFNIAQKIPIVEYWDINKLIEELDRHLLKSHLISGRNYDEELEAIILSISKNNFSIDKIRSFIDRNYDPNQNELFQLITIFILKRSENVDNIYAYFYFMEYLLVKIWRGKFETGDMEDISNFNTTNSIYIYELKKWCTRLTTSFEKEFGLYDMKSKPWSDISGYSLRIFNILRRISYIILNEDDRFERNRYLELLLKIIDNNIYVVFMPLAEFQFNDIGLVMIILWIERKVVEARNWLYTLIQNLILHFSLNYGILPLNKEINEIPNCILKKTEERELGTVISILLEFTYIFNASESYDILKNWIMKVSSRLLDSKIKEVLLPAEKYELELYETGLLHLGELQLDFSGVWNVDRKRYYQRISKITRKYSFSQRAYILILLSSVYKNRIGQDIWRSFIIQ